MTIQIPDNFMGKPIKGAMEKVLAGAPPIPVGSKTNVQVNTIDDYWQISGIEYRNEIYTVDLLKNLLDGGNAKTQNDWASLYEEAKDKNRFHTPDYPLFYGLVKALYTTRDDTTKTQEIGEAQKFLKDNSRAKWLMTLTRIIYQPNRDDIVIHNFNTKDQYQEKTDFVGTDGNIKTTGDGSLYKALLGTDNVQEINDVFQWPNGTNTYLWRVNSRPRKIDERVARFNANSGRADLGCNRDLSDSDSSLGVRAAFAKK